MAKRDPEKEEQFEQEIDVPSFLKTINLHHLIDVFEEENISMDILKGMTHDDLKEIGIKSFCDRQTIIKTARKVKDKTKVSGGKVSSPIKVVHSMFSFLQKKVLKKTYGKEQMGKTFPSLYVKLPWRTSETDNANEQKVLPLVKIYPKGEISVGVGGTIQLRLHLNIKENFRVWWKYGLKNADVGVILKTEDLKYAGSQSTVLQINNIDESDEGMYQALVRNAGGTRESSQVFIKVVGELDPNMISGEENNFLRLYMLCQKYGTEAIRTLFDNTIPPSTLEEHLDNHERDIMKKCKLSESQIGIIFPINPPPVTSTQLDISIMYSLLRNTTNVAPPRYKWAQSINDIGPNDILPVHDLERIRLFRNDLAHSHGPVSLKYTEKEFNSMWQNLEMAISRLSYGALANETHSLLTRKFDRSSQHGVMEEFKQMGRRLLVLEKECHIPIHIKEQHKQVLQKWAVDGELFQETRAYKRAKEIIEEKGVLFIVGGPGSGKTSIARHLAIQFQAQKWEIIPVRSPDEIRQYLYPVINQLFVLDNPFGNFGLDMSKHDRFVDLFDHLSCLSKTSTKIMFTCRKNVYVECNDLEPFAFEEESIIDIESNEYHLNGEERFRILETYCIKRNIPKVNYEHISVEDNYPMFPLLCSLLREGMDIKQRLSYPIECLQKELLIMRKCESITFVVLVLCVFRNNTCADKFLDENRQLLSELLLNCGLSFFTPISIIRDALIKLEGTYLSDVKDRITFTHDSVFEVVSHMYGKENTRHFLENISFEYLNNNVEIVMSRKISSNSSILQLQLEDCYHLSARIYNEIRQFNYHFVFGSKKSFLKDTKFITSFLRFLNWIQFAEIVDAFLVDHLHSSKWFDFDDEYSFQGHKSFRQRILTSHSSNKNMQKVRALSWILAFGHKEILSYLIKRSEKEKHGKRTRLDIWKLFLTDDLQEQTRLLMLACLSGELEIVNFVTRHFDYECLKIEYPTGLYVPLLVSCLTPYPHVVEALIHAGANVNATENAYYNVRDTAILTALKNKHTFVVKVLIEYGADVNKCNRNGETPLIIASRIGSLEIVKLLVENGADVEFLDMEDKTALFYGIKNHHTHIVKYLLEKGSDLSKFMDDKQSVSAFDFHCIQDDLTFIVENIDRITYRASEVGRVDIVEHLDGQKAHFPDPSIDLLVYVACKNDQFDDMKHLIESGYNVNYYDEQHTTPLCVASKQGSLQIVSYLIENTAVNPNQFDFHQKSPIHWATESNQQQIVEYLIKKGASVNILDENKTSPLHISCSEGNYEMVRFLLSHGADLNVKMRGGETPLFCAVANKRLKITELLIRNGADFYLDDSEKVLLLHLGSDLGNFEIVQRLVDLGCQVNECDKKNHIGCSPLSIAVERGYFDIVKYLVEIGKADVNLCDELNRSPLLKASENGNKEMVEFLLRNGAKVNTADRKHYTPLHMAVRNNHTCVVNILLQYGADIIAFDDIGNSPFDYVKRGILV